LQVYEHLKSAGFQKSLEAVVEMRRCGVLKMASKAASERVLDFEQQKLAVISA
jgi:hypothetical protein